MTKNLTTVLLTLLVLGGCAKEIPHEKLQDRNGIAYEVNSQTPFTGTALRYHDNGQIWTLGTFKDGKLHGKREIYYKNGTFNQIQNWKEGKKDGRWVEYYRDDGTLSLTSVWKDGEKEYQIHHPNKDGEIEYPDD